MIVSSLSGFLGTFPGWATVIIAAVLAFTLLRGGHPQAVTIMREDNTVLREEVTKLKHENHQLVQENERLKLQTSFEPMVSRVIEEFANHENGAQQRHEKMLDILNLIAARLGPDPDNAQRIE